MKLSMEIIIKETILNLTHQHTLIIKSAEDFFMNELIKALYVPAPKFNSAIGDL